MLLLIVLIKNIVDGVVVEGHYCWKGMIRTLLLDGDWTGMVLDGDWKGMDPDVGAG